MYIREREGKGGLVQLSFRVSVTEVQKWKSSKESSNVSRGAGVSRRP